MKKWFTLIELIVVISLVAILLWISLNISWERVNELNIRNENAEFIKSYNKQISRILNSSYIWDFHYSQLHTTIISWSSTISYVYWGKYENSQVTDNTLTETFQFWYQRIINTSTSWDSIILASNPLSVWCTINSNENIANAWFTVSSLSNNSQKCFNIDSHTCKLKQVQCWS